MLVLLEAWIELQPWPRPPRTGRAGQGQGLIPRRERQPSTRRLGLALDRLRSSSCSPPALQSEQLGGEPVSRASSPPSRASASALPELHSSAPRPDQPQVFLPGGFCERWHGAERRLQQPAALQEAGHAGPGTGRTLAAESAGRRLCRAASECRRICRSQHRSEEPGPREDRSRAERDSGEQEASPRSGG